MGEPEGRGPPAEYRKQKSWRSHDPAEPRCGLAGSDR